MAELRHRADLESTFAARFARLSSGFRRELIDLLGDPPDPARVPPEFWQRVEDESRAQLAVVLLLLWSESAHLHGLHGDDSRGAVFASTRATAAAASFAATSRDMLHTAGSDWSNRTAQGQRVPRSEVTERAVSIFGPDRAAKLADYETGRAQTDAGETWRRDQQAMGHRIAAIWRHSRFRPKHHAGAASEPCEQCTPLLDQGEEVWGLSAPSGPPLHPHCDCFLDYRVLSLTESELLECGGKGGTMGPCPKAVTDWASKRFKDPAHAKAFADWFGESKVTNENGEPLVVYHATAADFSTFDKKEVASQTGNKAAAKGHFFGIDPESLADMYATDDIGELRQGAKTIPVYLSLQNPKVYEVKSLAHFDRVYGDDSYAGDAIATHQGKPFPWVAVSPTSIKSATGNRGTFNPASPKINESVPLDLVGTVRVRYEYAGELKPMPYNLDE